MENDGSWQTTQARLSGSGSVNGSGEFEVLAITAGVGNGWEFGESCLKDSLALWNGAECFIDHSYWGHSIRDLAGVFYGSEWDTGSKGVKCRLRPVGPSKALLEELGWQLLKESAPEGQAVARPRVGFSADVVFTSQGKKVDKILRVLSVDLVFNPARGGAFLRALNAGHGFYATGVAERINGMEKGAMNMGEEEKSGSTTLQKEVETMRALLDVQKEQAKLQQEAEAARAVRFEMCAYLLESGLNASKLPAAMASQVRKQFNGRVFDAAELNTAIDDARKLVSELTGPGVVQGPNGSSVRLHGMCSSEDRLQLAVDDLFEVTRAAGQEAVKVEKLSGIRELYLMMTGDYDMHGAYHPERTQLAFSTDFPGLVKNAMNKVSADRWRELGRAGYDWWKAVVTIEHCERLNDITGILVGTVGDLPTVAEGAEYTELAVGDTAEVGSFTKYGGYIPLTLELIDRDQTRMLKQYPRQLANAGLRKISSLVAGIFTANSGAGPTMADTGALFNPTAVTTKGGHANLLTTALAEAAWETVCAAVYNQPLLVKFDAGYYGVGPKLGINPRYLLVPRALQLTARKLIYPTLQNAANITSENLQQGQPGDVITVPEWTDAMDWAAVCDPAIAPAIYIGERFGIAPEIYVAGDATSGAVFMNDETRIKVRHFLSVFVTDYRPLHKENVAG